MQKTLQPLWQRWQTDFWRVARFGLTGTLCSALHYGVYCLFLLFCSATLAYTAGYGVGLVANYALTTYFTFQKKPTKHNFLGFVGSHILNYFLEISLLHLFLWMAVNQWFAPILVMAIAVPVNFLLLRFIFVRNKK